MPKQKNNEPTASLAVLLHRYALKLKSLRLSAEETGRIEKLFRSLPPAYAENYTERLAAVISEKTRFGFLEASEGLAYEMYRLKEMFVHNGDRASPYEVRPCGKYIQNPKGCRFIPVTHEGTPGAPRLIQLENDVTLYRSGKPVIYDTKFFPTILYGRDRKTWSQVVKYNAAVEYGLAVSAVIEINGWIHPDFLGWLWGDTGETSNALPHVQVISAVPLPSGRVYRFNLKPNEDEALTFPIPPLRGRYRWPDSEIVEGIEAMQKKADFAALAEALMADDRPSLSTLSALEEGPRRELMLPKNFDNKYDYWLYRQERREGFWNRASNYGEVAEPTRTPGARIISRPEQPGPTG